MLDIKNILTPENAKSLVPEILSALASDGWSERNKGCKAVPSLVAMDPTTALALVDPVSRALRDPRPCVRYSACECVPVLVQAVPEKAAQLDHGLSLLTGDHDPDLADSARDTRRQIAPYISRVFGQMASSTHGDKAARVAPAQIPAFNRP